MARRSNNGRENAESGRPKKKPATRSLSPEYAMLPVKIFQKDYALAQFHACLADAQKAVSDAWGNYEVKTGETIEGLTRDLQLAFCAQITAWPKIAGLFPKGMHPAPAPTNTEG